MQPPILAAAASRGNVCVEYDGASAFRHPWLPPPATYRPSWNVVIRAQVEVLFSGEAGQ